MKSASDTESTARIDTFGSKLIGVDSVIKSLIVECSNTGDDYPFDRFTFTEPKENESLVTFTSRDWIFPSGDI